ncbi:hypothetical protein AAFA46_05490 [Oscillospiraceae bacterium WX1]
MKLKKILVIVSVIFVFSSCLKSPHNIGVGSADNGNIVTTTDVALIEDVDPNKDATNTSPSGIITQNTSFYYSTFSGSWFCEDKKTSLNLKIDDSGIVSGTITTVVGSQVPSSLIFGVIDNNILVTNLFDGDKYTDESYIGTLTLIFSEPQVLKGTVKLDKNVINLAEGNMLFAREK